MVNMCTPEMGSGSYHRGLHGTAAERGKPNVNFADWKFNGDRA
jgi:hypothetical protein